MQKSAAGTADQKNRHSELLREGSVSESLFCPMDSTRLCIGVVLQLAYAILLKGRLKCFNLPFRSYFESVQDYRQ